MIIKNAKKNQNEITTFKACVCFICVEGQIAGAEKSLLLLAEVVKKQYSIIAICPADCPLENHFKQMHIPCYSIKKISKTPGIIKKGLYLFKTNWRIWKIIKQNQPQIIHANNYIAALVSILAAILSRAKFIFHCRDFAGSKALIKLCSCKADCVIAVSKAIKYWLIKQGCKKKKIRVIYNSIKNPTKIIEEKFTNKTICFGNVGQFVSWKRQEIFIEAAEIVHQQRSDVRFCIVGDDIFNREANYKKQLIQKIQNSLIRDCLTITGWQENMENVWKQIDCLVHTADNEPFGRVIIEAMAHEITVIAINYSGPSEIIQNNITGILVDDNDPAELAQAIMQIAGNKYHAKKLAKAGRKKVYEKFTSNKTGYEIMNIYERLLA